MRYTHDVQSLNTVMEEIKVSAARLLLLITTMEAEGIASLSINHQREMERGLRGIGDWISSGQKSLRDLSIKKGRFQSRASSAIGLESGVEPRPRARQAVATKKRQPRKSSSK
jgi:hypothetical protein